LERSRILKYNLKKIAFLSLLKFIEKINEQKVNLLELNERL